MKRICKKMIVTLLTVVLVFNFIMNPFCFAGSTVVGNLIADILSGLSSFALVMVVGFIIVIAILVLTVYYLIYNLIKGGKNIMIRVTVWNEFRHEKKGLFRKNNGEG